MADEAITEQVDTATKEEAVETIMDSMQRTMRFKTIGHPIFFPSRSMKVRNKRRRAHLARTKRG